MATVELLYFEGCPGYEALLGRLANLLGDAVDIDLRHITSLEDAEAQRFLGSPTLRVNGKDVEPAAEQRTDFGLKCRLYRSAEGQSHVPPDAWIRAALDAS